MVSDQDRMIQDRAYEIWVEGGRQDGHADRNWEQAVREITAKDQVAVKSEKAAGADAIETKIPKEKAPKPKVEKAAKTMKAKAEKAKTEKAPAPKKSPKSDKPKGGELKSRGKK